MLPTNIHLKWSFGKTCICVSVYSLFLAVCFFFFLKKNFDGLWLSWTVLNFFPHSHAARARRMSATPQLFLRRLKLMIFLCTVNNYYWDFSSLFMYSHGKMSVARWIILHKRWTLANMFYIYIIWYQSRRNTQTHTAQVQYECVLCIFCICIFVYSENRYSLCTHCILHTHHTYIFQIQTQTVIFRLYLLMCIYAVLWETNIEMLNYFCIPNVHVICMNSVCLSHRLTATSYMRGMATY